MRRFNEKIVIIDFFLCLDLYWPSTCVNKSLQRAEHLFRAEHPRVPWQTFFRSTTAHVSIHYQHLLEMYLLKYLSHFMYHILHNTPLFFGFLLKDNTLFIGLIRRRRYLYCKHFCLKWHTALKVINFKDLFRTLGIENYKYLPIQHRNCYAPNQLKTELHYGYRSKSVS